MDFTRSSESVQSIEMIILKITSLTAVILLLCWECQCLRCRTDDGPTDDEIRKIARTCMHRVGENETDNDFNGDENDSESNEQNYDNGDTNDRTNSNRYNNNNFNNGFNFQSDYQNDPYTNVGSAQGNRGRGNGFDRSNTYSDWNNPNTYGGNGGSNTFGGNSNGNYNQRNSQNNNNQFDQRNGYGNSYHNNNQNNQNLSNNQTEQDRACLIHCFFHEFKMTNSEDYPDQRKMLQVLTKDMRDREIKEFYVDSIQECFHVVDNMDNYNRRKDKCDMAYKIVTCLTERAKTNCDDYQNDMMMF